MVHHDIIAHHELTLQFPNPTAQRIDLQLNSEALLNQKKTLCLYMSKLNCKIFHRVQSAMCKRTLVHLHIKPHTHIHTHTQHTHSHTTHTLKWNKQKKGCQTMCFKCRKKIFTIQELTRSATTNRSHVSICVTDNFGQGWALLTCYLAKYGYSRSNNTSIITEIRRKIWPLTSRLSRLLQFTGTDTDWLATYDFLLVIHSNHRPILYCVR